jgi:5-methylcytosine-specific restriction endonuclease McrA
VSAAFVSILFVEFSTDKRRLDIGLDQAPELRLPDLHGHLRRTQIEVARTLVAVAVQERHAFCGHATVEQLGAAMGYGEEETRALRLVGEALALMPELEELLLEGDLSLADVETIGSLARVPELRADLECAGEPDEACAIQRARWIALARRLPAKEFRRLVKRRIAEARSRVPMITLVTPISLDVEQDIDRARIIASRKAERTLSRGETIGEAVRHYLDCFDPLLRREAPAGSVRNGASGAVDAAFDPSKRKLPAATQRLVRRRARDRCEYDGCTNAIHLQFAHIVPHSQGGARDEGNIVLLCTRHHFMLDARIIGFGGWRADQPRFRLNRELMLGRSQRGRSRSEPGAEPAADP